ncbi:Low-density lipoprotein receptor- protein 1B, partial [Cichlidogyrus casuarinus]
EPDPIVVASFEPRNQTVLSGEPFSVKCFGRKPHIEVLSAVELSSMPSRDLQSKSIIEFEDSFSQAKLTFDKGILSEVERSVNFRCTTNDGEELYAYVHIKPRGDTGGSGLYCFTCPDTNKCIPLYKLCNRQPDCPNGSDELNPYQCSNKKPFLRWIPNGPIIVPENRPFFEVRCELISWPGQLASPNNLKITINNAPAESVPGVVVEYIWNGATVRVNPYSRQNFTIVCSDEYQTNKVPVQVTFPPAEVNCAPDQFRCNFGQQCISSRLVCDGSFDCADRSDEAPIMDCGRSCAPHEFRCKSGECVPSNWRCNTAIDCPDRSDEIGCAPPEKVFWKDDNMNIEFKATCYVENRKNGSALQVLIDNERPNWPFEVRREGYDRVVVTAPRNAITRSITLQCSTGNSNVALLRLDPRSDCPPGHDFCSDRKTCIPKSSFCDKKRDCPDGSDESDCGGTTTCTGTERRCNNGQCMDFRRFCNGQPDCADGSDEWPSNCNNLCEPSVFVCQNQLSKIPIAAVCDGEKDCRDGSDEVQCAGCKFTLCAANLS